MNNENTLKFDPNVLDDIEKLIYELRTLYYGRGYKKYRMSKFEEYDLYVKNKDFLVSDSIITFTDTKGTLMALKPDVTLSIIKSTKDNKSSLQKICYNENVYRVSKDTDSFKEIMQSGLEVFGDVDCGVIGEVLILAAKSLQLIRPDYIIECAQIDILSDFADMVSKDLTIKRELLKCVSEKNIHGITQLCIKNNISINKAEPLKNLISIYGSPYKVLPDLKSLCTKEQKTYLDELEKSLCIVKDAGYEEHMIIDFSVVSDLKYYNGIIFNGFVSGIPSSVLLGGQYDKLMKRMGRSSKGIGFAVYLDCIERIVIS